MFRKLPYKTSLFNQDTFYKKFTSDLLKAKEEVIIESPFITEKRMTILLPILAKMRRQNVKIVVNTRDPIEHNSNYYRQALNSVARMQELGVEVLYTSGLHRKIAVIDREIAYEGSLNILSFNDTCEIMRRTASTVEAKMLLDFIDIRKHLC